ncbi:hypothetical protein [Mangrovibacterium diazotrophicum]|uniref:Uncharacterized protein n=1 Tax=Mangrovibacterium diazotrophicum TaxID=1261403 RepID=A0A419VXF2_9BACT|nr:hypothetical protein [Mangrovibacterium diazotrophicum]RKD87903.1 hypothetical protein BC643_3911 [Mangrovibacterium diazotrophicum]
MQFKQLDLKPQGNWFQRNIWTQHGKKTLVYMAGGAVLSLVFSLITGDLQKLSLGENVYSLMIGALFGFLITNSPCARGRC